MSADPDHGFLAIDAGAGVGFRILDTEGKEVGRGTGKWTQPQAPGLYAVQWASATDQHETLVRVSPRTTASAVYAPAATGVSGGGIGATLMEAPRIVEELRPSAAAADSSIAVVLVSGRDVDEAEILRDLRLLDTRETTISGTDNQLVGIGAEGRETARSFAVRPGRYLLTYRAMTGETLQQTVPALRGRQTMIFMEAAKGDVLLAEGEGFARVSRTGIDPARTVMISLAGDEGEPRIRERLRLTRLLLRDLSTGSASLTHDFITILDQPQTDPLLKLAGVLTVLAHVESGTSPSIDEPSRHGDSPQDHRYQWLPRAAEWLRDLRHEKLPPDVAIAWWQLKRLGFEGRPDKVASSINVPPMYTCAWRWAAARSADYPGAIRRYAAVRAATRSRGPTEPWLSWKATAAKAAPSAARSGGAGRIEALAQSVAEKSRLLIGNANDALATADIIARAGPEAGIMAMHANSLSRSIQSTGSLPSDLASALSMPGRTLQRYLASTNQQLSDLLSEDSVLAQATRDASISVPLLAPRPDIAPTYIPEEDAAAPGLVRRIEHSDDPQKGRFGSLSTRQGYAARAEFAETTSRNWTRITLIVEGPALDRDEVLFYLHDSFPKDVRRERFRDGRAKTSVTSWGGFTVGIWLPRQGIELELDLALLPDAPVPIRTR